MIPGPNAENQQPLGKMTAYAFFVQLCRDEHKKTYPGETVVFEVFSRKCAERWKTMTEREKYSFQEMAEEDRKRYEMECTNMQNMQQQAGGGKMPKQRKKKDPNAPKRSMSAFFWFSQDERKKVREANPKFGVGEVAKELGRRWADIDPVLKKKYEGLAEEDRKRYSQAKTDYKNSLKGGSAKKGLSSPTGSAVPPLSEPSLSNYNSNDEGGHGGGQGEDPPDGGSSEHLPDHLPNGDEEDEDEVDDEDVEDE